MRIIKVNLLILIILLAASGMFAKITRYEAEDLFGIDTCSSIIYDLDASNDSCRVVLIV